eukprot:NODE_385_length_9550_cov_0.159877.p3 type:complete len:213 gc:universal NODE_385_length_9550_cov_0.159877:6293-6931(+)
MLVLTLFASSSELPSGFERVTFGSLIKLVHHKSDYRLNSIGVNYASGSGQQVVTSVPTAKDTNSYWMVRNGFSEEQQDLGTVVSCDSIIRLQHANTQKHLHSHYHSSPVSKQQEVSAFGEENLDDNWKVICTHGDFWTRDEPIQLLHIGTDKYLSSSESHSFGNPIQGQLEIYASANDDESKWKASEGIYVGEDEDNLEASSSDSNASREEL